MICLSKSRFLKGRQCSRRLWLEAQGIVEPALESVEVWQEREGEGAEFERLVATLFPDAVRMLEVPDEEDQGERRGDVDRSVEKTRWYLSGDRPLLQAPLAVDRLLAIADLLERRAGGWYLWEIKASTAWKPIFDWDLAFQCEVARRAGLPVVGAGVITLDSGYRRGEALDIEALIVREDRTRQVVELEVALQAEITRQLEILDQADVPPATPGSRCKANTAARDGDRPSACGHLVASGFCGARLPRNWAGRLPHLVGAKEAFVRAMPDPSIENLDANDDDLAWTPPQRRMIVAVQRDEPYVDADALHAKLDELHWPVAYVDFEFDPGMAVPRYVGSRPYERIPFQWSMQIQRRPGAALEEPKAFLHVGADDPRRPFMDSLLDSLPHSGSIVAHHESAELTVLKQTAAFLGDRCEEVVGGLRARFFDTEKLLQAAYYHPMQQGSYSIKKVAPALLGRGYEDLDIQDGMAAVVTWKRASSPECPPAERDALSRQLLAYCGRDTLLMHEIVEALRIIAHKAIE